jgi:hypothetical protein
MANKTSDRTPKPVRDEDAVGVKTENCQVDQCEKRLLFDEIERLREQNDILQKLVEEYKVRIIEIARQRRSGAPRSPGQIANDLECQRDTIQAPDNTNTYRCPATRQVFEIVIAALNYDGKDINSLTVGEIRRALP